MSSEFNALYETIMAGKSVTSPDDLLFTEGVVSKMADWADALQKGWGYLSGKIYPKPEKPPRDYEADTEALKERQVYTDKVFQKLTSDLYAYDFDKLTLDDVHDIREKAQIALDEIVALHITDDVPDLKARVDKLVSQYIAAQNTWRGDQPGDISVNVPKTSEAMADTSYSPMEKEVPDSFKAALAKAKEILATKYDIQDKKISWGNKLIMLMMVFGLANNVKFD